jgi:hypothetical protein
MTDCWAVAVELVEAANRIEAAEISILFAVVMRENLTRNEEAE